MAKPLKSSVKETRPVKLRHEGEEFGKGKRGLIICPDCKAVYFKKSWHHSMVHFGGKKEDASVTFALCPADQMIKNGQYEGKVVVKNLAENFASEVINLIKNTADIAFENDPMDRLISVKKEGKDLVALTTENELAVKIAKKIKDAHAKAKVKISYFSEPSDVSLAVVEF